MKYDVDNVQDVITHIYGIEGDLVGDELYLSCPNPGHLDKSPSCSVNVNTGLFHCFSCGIGGDIVQLGVLVLGESRDAVITKLTPSSPEHLLTSISRRIEHMKGSIRVRHKKLHLPGPYDKGPYDFLLERGFTLETIKRWDIRYVKKDTLEGKDGKFTIADSIAIPIRDRNKHLLGYCYRKTKKSPEWQPRYLYTPGLALRDTWFGVHHHYNVKHVVITEGALDAIWFDQLGFPAIAILGSKSNEHKLNWLQHYRSLTLFCDRDLAGVHTVNQIGNHLYKKVPIHVARYHSSMKGTDPQELTSIEILKCISRSVPYMVWKQKEKAAKDL